MPKDLSTLFAEQETNVLEWDGAPAYGLYEFAQIPKCITVGFMAAKLSPVQGLHLKIRGGALEANGVEATNMVLWRDTAAVIVDVKVRPTSGTPSLKLWNIWRVNSDVVQAWVGNSAMRIEEGQDSNSMVLRCSDGEGPADFDDLVVRLMVTW